MVLVTGQRPLDDLPELGTVIGTMEMRELVHQHIVNQARRKLHGRPVDVDLTVG